MTSRTVDVSATITLCRYGLTTGTEKTKLSDGRSAWATTATAGSLAARFSRHQCRAFGRLALLRSISSTHGTGLQSQRNIAATPWARISRSRQARCTWTTAARTCASSGVCLQTSFSISLTKSSGLLRNTARSAWCLGSTVKEVHMPQCRACKAEIVLLKTAHGKTIPVNAGPEVKPGYPRTCNGCGGNE